MAPQAMGARICAIVNADVIITTRTAHYESFTMSGAGYNDLGQTGTCAIVNAEMMMFMSCAAVSLLGSESAWSGCSVPAPIPFAAPRQTWGESMA